MKRCDDCRTDGTVISPPLVWLSVAPSRSNCESLAAPESPNAHQSKIHANLNERSKVSRSGFSRYFFRLFVARICVSRTFASMGACVSCNTCTVQYVRAAARETQRLAASRQAGREAAPSSSGQWRDIGGLWSWK